MSESDDTPTSPLDVLGFWFGDDPGQPLANSGRWFERSDAFDAEIRARFATDVERAGRGELDGWMADPHGALALVILLDQFPRNLHRESPAAFAHDPKALDCTRAAHARGAPEALSLVERWFLAMPFMHAEDVAAQDEGLALFRALAAEARAHGPELAGAFDYVVDFAVRHREVVARFGRFPHRNPVLGRETTPEEQAWLDGHPDGF